MSDLTIGGLFPEPNFEIFHKRVMEPLRSLAERVKTASLRIFHLDPAKLDSSYQMSQRKEIFQWLADLKSVAKADEASEQHVFVRLAKAAAYADFSTLTEEERRSLEIPVPLFNRTRRKYELVTYHLNRTIKVAGFCECHILTAPGRPPIALVPGTFPHWDHPSKAWETVGENFQGTIWKTIADDLERTVAPVMADLSREAAKGRPSFFKSYPSGLFIGHSAGAGAIRQLLGRGKKISHPEIRKNILQASFHAFAPPATSAMRAKIIDEIESGKGLPKGLRPGGFTTYLDPKDPVTHLGGTVHAGRVLVSDPEGDDRTVHESHSAWPVPKPLGNWLIVPYQGRFSKHWSLNAVLSNLSITLVATVNILGLNAAVSTVKPLIKQAIITLIHLVKAIALLTAGFLCLEKGNLLEGLERGDAALAAMEKWTAALVSSPIRFLYVYWNNLVAPAIYAATGVDLYLRSQIIDSLQF